MRHGPAGRVVWVGDAASNSYNIDGTSTIAIERGEVYVASHNGSGALEWVTVLGTGAAPNLIADDVAVAADGSVYVLLHGRGTYGVTGGATFTMVRNAVGVVKLSPSGAFQWYHGGETATTDWAQEIQVSNDRVIVAGWTSSTAIFGGVSLSSTAGSGYLVSWTSGGDFEYFVRFPGTVRGAALLADGLHVAGEFRGTVDFGGTTLVAMGTFDDFYLAVFDPATGAPRSALTYGTSTMDTIYDVAWNASGEAVLDNRSVELVRLASDGSVVWSVPGRHVNALAISSDGRVTLAAETGRGSGLIRRLRPDGSTDIDLTLPYASPRAIDLQGTRLAVVGSFDDRFEMGSIAGGTVMFVGVYAALLDMP